MLIDWFTVIAQAVNFVILVVVLKFLLFDRIVQAMEQRRRAIAAREAEADERIRAAEEALSELEGQRRKLDTQRDEILEATRREVGDQRRELLHEAREEAERVREEWRRSIRSRQQRLLRDMQRLTGEQAVTITRRLLTDLTDQSMEEAVVSALVDRIGELSDADRTAIADSVNRVDAPILVRSAFDLSATSREHVEEVLRELVGDLDRPISWQQDADLISGIVIQAGSHTVSWSVAGYLDDVEREFAELLRAAVGPLRAEDEE